MEKLIELLNEYKEKKNICNTDMDGQLEIGNYRYVNYPCAERLCSKKYGFIKWLVDNDKIDLVRLSCTAIRYTEIIDADFSRENRILMILAIQYSPIEFLCGIIK